MHSITPPYMTRLGQPVFLSFLQEQHLSSAGAVRTRVGTHNCPGKMHARLQGEGSFLWKGFREAVGLDPGLERKDYDI